MYRTRIRGFLEFLIRRVQIILKLKGCRVVDKIRLLVLTLLESIPRRVTSHLPLILRRIMDMVKNGLVSNVIVNINGNLFYCIDSESPIILSPEYELRVQKCINNLREGDTFIDVGAHIGRYTIQAAKIVGKSGLVIAVEPHPKNYEVLLKNVRLNRLENVIALNIAAWSNKCKLKLYTGYYGGLHSIMVNHGLGYIVVRAMALDDVLDKLGVRKVNVIKIDVEGAELEVLKGLTKTLKSHRPIVIVEIWENPTKMAKVRHFIEQVGYDMQKIDIAYYILKPK